MIFLTDDPEFAPSAELVALVQAHEAEAKRVGAEFYNFGWAQTDTGIASKTSAGILDTERTASGNIVHNWS